MTIAEKVVLITGGSRGIGRATALRMAAPGLKIAVNYHQAKEEADKVVELLKAKGADAISVHADVSDQAQVQSMTDIVTGAWGNVDILVNNAGIVKDSLLVAMSVEDWDRVINVDLRGTFLCTRAVIRGMIRKKWGRIINVGSVVGIRGNPGQTNYAAAKAGGIGFAKALAKEVASRNITVNVVTPGYVSTDVVDVLPQTLKDRILKMIPQQHFGTAGDVANMVAYLASEEANYITGQVISVDGGLAV